ncbi:hypothetical protein [Eikenella corrodens]|uniref:hypothetical protein n=1 Tax=Eikenella corrodens TaxID=539 RepID=UPI0028E6D043|nr:hypothetical protein [Eikenella corrodens]
MKQRIEDWLRERRIKRIGRRLVAAHRAKAGNVRQLLDLFYAEIANRSPQQIARMMAEPMSKRMAKANKRILKQMGAEK